MSGLLVSPTLHTTAGDSLPLSGALGTLHARHIDFCSYSPDCPCLASFPLPFSVTALTIVLHTTDPFPVPLYYNYIISTCFEKGGLCYDLSLGKIFKIFLQKVVWSQASLTVFLFTCFPTFSSIDKYR